MDASYSFLLDLITTLAGAYVLYTWFKLKKEGKLFENQLLVPKGSKPSECLDEGEYIRYTAPRLLILGLVCFLTGGISALDAQTGFLAKLFPTVEKISYYVDLTGQMLSLAVLIWYAVCWIKSRKEYWVTDL